MEEQLIAEIFKRMTEEGFGEETEPHEICKRALQFRSFAYKRSEELEAGTTVDCSTLVSQAHWEGALIGIPFIAESQRKAASGKTIASRQDLIPADVLIKYQSLEAGPDKTYNHVGLYLGRDAKGEQWLIESTSRTGVQLSTVDAFDIQGGIKRFTLSNQPFKHPQAQAAISLATLVPKFGRLGVRQYRKSGGERLIHKGLDLYMPVGTPVHATTNGTVALINDPIEDADGVEIAGKGLTVRLLMLGDIEVKTGETVLTGDMLGKVVSPSQRSDIVYSPTAGQESHLHLEVEQSVAIPRELANQVVAEGKTFLNHLYLSKSARLALPFGG